MVRDRKNAHATRKANKYPQENSWNAKKMNTHTKANQHDEERKQKKTKKKVDTKMYK